MRTVVSRQQVWTEPEWRAYIGRLCGVRLTLYEFYSKMPFSRGLRLAFHFDPFIEAHRRLVEATIALESIVIDHLGGERAVPGGAIAFCNGKSIGIPDDDEASVMPAADNQAQVLAMTGATRKSAPVLPQEEWFEWGRKGKQANDDLCAAICEVQYAKGVSKKHRHIRGLSSANKFLLRGRVRLDSLVYEQYPHWPEFTKVFFGRESAG
jgi:hypothetical protein